MSVYFVIWFLIQTTSAHQQYSDDIEWYQNSQYPYVDSIPPPPNPPQIEFIDPWDTYYETSNIQTETELHDCFVDAIVENVEYLVPSQDHEQNHETFHIPNDNHQHNHKQNANVDSLYTITEPHISIQSSSKNESDDNKSNSNFHQNITHVGDTSIHSINLNSFLTFNHDNSYANTSASPSIGNDTNDENGERDRNSCPSENHNRDVEDVNDESSDTCEEVGNINGGG